MILSKAASFQQSGPFKTFWRKGWQVLTNAKEQCKQLNDLLWYISPERPLTATGFHKVAQTEKRL